MHRRRRLSSSARLSSAARKKSRSWWCLGWISSRANNMAALPQRLAEHYAQALFELGTKDPSRTKDYLKNLEQVLERRGHQKLFPRILAHLKTIEERQAREKKYKKFTKDDARTRTLVELYRTLIH